MSHDEQTRPLEEFESQLAALRPVPSGVDRAALLYAAGHAAGAARVRPRSRLARWLSPLVTTASVALAATFAVLWWNEVQQPAPQIASSPPKVVVEPAVEDEVDEAAPAAIPNTTESFFHLRRVALSEGVDAWPQRWPSGQASSPPTARSLWPLGEG